MVVPGTPFVSSTFSRVSSVLSRNVILGNTRRVEEELLRVQEQLATGLRILRPSDDIVASNRVLDFTTRISRDDQFLRNIERGLARLNTSDVSLGALNDVAVRAKEIALQQIQSTATSTSRQNAATEVAALLQQAVNLGNTQFEDRFLFAGSRSEAAPFLFVGDAVAFVGDVRSLQADVADGLRATTNVTADVLGVLSDEIRGVDLTAGPTFLQPIDMNPAVSLTTRLSALNGGEGVRLGSIQVAGTGSATIDLRIAESVGDVIDLINAQSGTTGVTAAISPTLDGLRLTSGAPITVQEVGGGATAADLGILATAAASPFDGTDLDPNVTEDTLLADLFAGAGIDPAGLTITNSTPNSTFTATFGAATFGAGATVGRVLNDLNSANVFVDARISESNRGIDVLSRLSGGRLTIAESGGTTAADLGILSTLARSRIQELNGGLGVGSVDGFDLRITKKDGTQVFFDVDSATNVQALVDAIDGDPGLTAAIVAGGVEVTDVTGGGGPLVIENFNGSFAATNLGIAGTTAGVTISGTPLTFVGVQPEGLFTALLQLRDALTANDPFGINRAAEILDSAQAKLLGARSEAGARVSSLKLTENRLGNEKVELEKLVSSTRDIDMAEAATRFQIQQTVLEASLSVAARILQTSLLNFL